MKKILLGLGTLATVAIPVVTVVSCGKGDDVVISPLQKLKNEYIKNHTLTAEELQKVNAATSTTDLNTKTAVMNTAHLKPELKTLLGDIFDSKISELGTLADKYADTGSRKKELRESSKTEGIVKMLKVLSNLNSKGLKSVIGATPEEFDKNFNTVTKLLPGMSAKLSTKYVSLVKGILYGFKGDAMRFGELPVLQLTPAATTGLAQSTGMQVDLNSFVKQTLERGFYVPFMSLPFMLGTTGGIVGLHTPGTIEKNPVSGKLFGQETDASIKSFKEAQRAGTGFTTTFDKTGVFDKMFENGLFSMDTDQIHTMGMSIRGLSSSATELKDKLKGMESMLNKFVTFCDSISFDTANGRLSISSIIHKMLSKGLDKITTEELSNLLATIRVTMAADGTRIIGDPTNSQDLIYFLVPRIIGGSFFIREGVLYLHNPNGLEMTIGGMTVLQAQTALKLDEKVNAMTVAAFQKAVTLKYLHSDLFAPTSDEVTTATKIHAILTKTIGEMTKADIDFFIAKLGTFITLPPIASSITTALSAGTLNSQKDILIPIIATSLLSLLG
ncbi:MAG: hypothetical protein KAG14_01500 [Mycoplasmataceae bacterium]|nr:hypothetical protein [Mycoplasmataceae bacterium]